MQKYVIMQKDGRYIYLNGCQKQFQVDCAEFVFVYAYIIIII